MKATLQKGAGSGATARNREQEFVSPEVNIFETKDGYVLEAEMPGFAKYRREGIQLIPDQQARVDVAMEVSTQATQVTVTAEAGTPIETESAAIQGIVVGVMRRY